MATGKVNVKAVKADIKMLEKLEAIPRKNRGIKVNEAIKDIKVRLKIAMKKTHAGKIPAHIFPKNARSPLDKLRAMFGLPLPKD